MNLTFRVASDVDADVITELNCRLAEETEGKCLDQETVRAGVRTGLRLSPEVRYFVAECDGQVVGQLMVTREWSDWRNGWMIWLQSVYVVDQFRRCGVFRTLYKYAIEAIRNETAVVCVRLYVEHANEAAKSCYKSLGFQSSGYEVLEIDFTKP